MPTNTAGTTARRYHQSVMQELSIDLTFADNGVVRTVGILPAGARIHRGMSGVVVNQVFNAGTTNVLDIGTSADGDLYMTDGALGTAAFVALDEAVDYRINADTTITATVALSGTAATTGAATVFIVYSIPSQG